MARQRLAPRQGNDNRGDSRMNVFILTRTKDYGGTKVLDVFASESVAEKELLAWRIFKLRDEFNLIEMEVTE